MTQCMLTLGQPNFWQASLLLTPLYLPVQEFNFNFLLVRAHFAYFTRCLTQHMLTFEQPSLPPAPPDLTPSDPRPPHIARPAVG